MSSKRVFAHLSKLLKEGRGFDFQSQGLKNDADFFNFALYSHPDTPISQYKSIYVHKYTLEELADSMDDILEDTCVVKPIPPMPKMPLPLPRM